MHRDIKPDNIIHAETAQEGQDMADHDVSEHINIGLDLANDLASFADKLEAGPSGWLIMPLLAHASKGVEHLPPERIERLRGALLTIVYGLKVEATKTSLVDEIRRVSHALQEAHERAG